MFTKFNEITQCNGHYAVQARSYKVTDFGTNRKLIYDFLLVINTNLPHIIMHRFQVRTMADYWSNLISLERGECMPHFNAPAGMIPCQYRHKWYIAKTRFFGLHFRCRKYWCDVQPLARNPTHIVRPRRTSRQDFSTAGLGC